MSDCNGILNADPRNDFDMNRATRKPSNSASQAIATTGPNRNLEAMNVLDEDIRSTTRTRAPRSTGARKTHQRGRMDIQRRDKGRMSEDDIAKALQNKLYPGVKNEQSAADRLEVENTFKAIVLCITTRAIGFGTITTFLAIFDLHNVPQRGDIYQFYRVSLALFESKMQFTQRGVQMIMEDMDDYETLHNSADFMQMCRTKPVMPDPITRPINAIGNVKVHERQYYPRFAANRMDNERNFIPQSEKVTFSNLRRTVVALSNPATPLEYRRRFYNDSPLPGAKWNAAEFLLLNPDDLMPNGYDVQNLSDDMDDVQPKIDFLAKKLPKYFTEPVNFEIEGRRSMLSSNKQSGMRVLDRGINQPLHEYYRDMRIIGDISQYYNTEPLTPAEQLSSSICLLGEWPTSAAAMYPTYVTRDRRACPQVSSVSYSSAI